MPVEPPVVSPASLLDAYPLLAEGPARPIAGGTDLMVSLTAELHPIDDVRSTAEYRRLVAARVLHRLIREAGGW